MVNLNAGEKIELNDFMKSQDAIRYVYSLAPHAAPARRMDLKKMAEGKLEYLQEENRKRAEQNLPEISKEDRRLFMPKSPNGTLKGTVMSVYEDKQNRARSLEAARDANNAALEALGGRAPTTHDR